MNAHTGLPQLPADVDIEQAVIGACIAQPELLARLQSVCTSGDFFHQPHPRIVEAMFGLAKDGRKVSPLSVQSIVGSDIGLDDPAHVYLANLAAGAPAGGFEDYLRRLIDLSRRREVMLALMDAQEQLGMPSSSTMEALRPLMEAVDRAARDVGGRDVIPVSEAIEEMLRTAQAALEGKRPEAVSTGLSKLDDVIGGLQAGDLAVYAGRPGMGKSALLMTTALAAARQGRPAIVFSLEMNQRRLLERMACDVDYDAHPHDPLSYSWFRKGSATFPQVERLASAARLIPDRIQIYDAGDLSMTQIAGLARAHAQKADKMGVIVIDYLQKVRSTDRYAGNKVQEITEISGAAKALAMQIGWPVVVGAQLNRGVEAREEKRPTLSDLRESGAIEQDADQVIGLFRPAYYVEKRRPALGAMDPKWDDWLAEYEPVKHRLDLFVLKNRHGAEDSVMAFCDMRASAIRDEAVR